MGLKQWWIDEATRLLKGEPEFYDGAKKIYRSQVLVHQGPLGGDLKPEDAGYQKTKMSLLRSLYLHEESLDLAVSLWDRRVSGKKYGSVGFTCYNHLLKPHSKSADSEGSRSSMMGPCLQSVVLTQSKDKKTHVDVFYRTTELLKKFPADLILLRDDMLSRFDFSSSPIQDIRFHLANATVSPTYVSTLIPHLEDPVDFLEGLAKVEPRLHRAALRMLDKFLVDEATGNAYKFNQARRVGKSLRRMTHVDQQSALRKYVDRSLTKE